MTNSACYYELWSHIVALSPDCRCRDLRMASAAMDHTNQPGAAVAVGITDTHHWWRVPALGHHLLVAGATGAGKGSALWSVIAGLAPAVKTGQVRLCVVDPKGGMERGAGAPLFTAFLTMSPKLTLNDLYSSPFHSRWNCSRKLSIYLCRPSAIRRADSVFSRSFSSKSFSWK